MTPPSVELVVGGALAASVAIAWVRLIGWQIRAPAAVRSRGWRLAALLVLQPVAAALLYATLLPPVRPGGADGLVIATAGTQRLIAVGPHERLVALPEAGPVAGAARAPDLGTALRQHPGTQAVRIVGSGLEPRDLAAATGLALRFDPPPPQGLVALFPPPPTAPGAAFVVAAQVRRIAGTSAELRDPAGRLVDMAPIGADGSVHLSATARGPGAALFTLRIRTAHAIVADAAVPVRTEAAPPAHLLLIAGAPGPEVKYLRRWASDAGLAPAVRAEVGNGVAIGDAPAAIDAATLTRYDSAILDDRAWAQLSPGSRQAFAGAVRDGLGLLVRLTGPMPRGWSVLGLGVAGDGTTAAVTLPPAAPTDAALVARRGPGSVDAPTAFAGERDAMPVLTRQAVRIGSGDAVPMLRDARGTILAAWRRFGRGRVAVTSVQDSAALVPSGQGDRFADMWSMMTSTIARPRPIATPLLDPLPRAGRRMTICTAGAAIVVAPDRATTRLLPDPATGTPDCAGYWPTTAGWHQLSTARGPRSFYVLPADALPTVGAEERRVATLRLRNETPATVGGAPGDHGAAWPWFLSWLLVAGAMWWLERARPGRGRA